ncbi:MAG: chemotaxis protein CheW [Desulfuromonadales bacterium]|nr:chemotaxis protein CheW [Desulfuromonadales bacterium]
MEALQLTNQYLTFRLDGDLFAVDVSKAREVLDFADVTRVPQTPDYMLGVINLRGNVVPVINLRRKFGMDDAERTVDTCIIVIEIELKDETVVIGVVADAVQEVLDLDAGQIAPPPRLGTRLNTEFIRGMGNLNDQFIILLDIDRVFTHEEIAVIDQSA